MSETAPASLAWVALFVASANRALGDDIIAATLEQRTDPLQWVLVLTSCTPWRTETAAGLRMILKDWATYNRADYRRSEYDGRVLKALIYIRGLGPEMNFNPYDESEDEKRRHRRLR